MHRLGKKITAHAHGAEAVRFCAEAGFDSIEHCTMIDDEGLKLMKDKGVYCVPTLYVIDFLTRPDNPMGNHESIVEKAKRMLGFQRERFSKIVKAGVPVAYGTDIGVFPHVNEVMDEFFDEPYPARAVIGVAALPKGALVEADAILAS